MLPTSTRLSLSIDHTMPADADGVILFATDDRQLVGDGVMILRHEELATAMRLLSHDVVEGRVKEIDFDLLESGNGRVQRIYVAGLGPAERITSEVVRQAAGTVIRVVRKHRLKHVAIVPPVIHRGRESHGTEATLTGLMLADFEYLENKGTASAEKVSKTGDIQISFLCSEKARAEEQRCLDRGRIIAECQNFARTIAWRPGNTINPPALATVAQAMARETGIACRVLDEKQMAKLGMGGILAVGGGSSLTPPRMIALEYKPKKLPAGSKPLLIVGKAITFDTGGISIKPAEKMGKMIFDKCGGMAVLGAMAAIARLKLPIHVVGILASAENHVSASAYRPGDVLTMYNGVTVEVTNTDAEGRLVLADAIAWGIETYRPSACIDLATLTGGVIVALGRSIAGIMGNDDGLIAELTEIGSRTGEQIWRLPLGEAQRNQIKSEPADIVNSAGRDAHPLQGAAFLSHFVPTDGSIPWAHLDIAGVADTDKDLPYYAKGATGWGVRLLVEWASKRSGVTGELAPSQCVPNAEIASLPKRKSAPPKPAVKKSGRQSRR